MKLSALLAFFFLLHVVYGEEPVVGRYLPKEFSNFGNLGKMIKQTMNDVMGKYTTGSEDKEGEKAADNEQYEKFKEQMQVGIDELKKYHEQYKESFEKAFVSLNKKVEEMLEGDQFSQMASQTEEMMKHFLAYVNATFQEMIEQARSQLPNPEIEQKIKVLEEAREQFKEQFLANVQALREYVQNNLSTKEGRDKFMEQVKEMISNYIKSLQEDKENITSTITAMYKAFVDVLNEEFGKEREVPQSLQEGIDSFLGSMAQGMEKFTSGITDKVKGVIDSKRKELKRKRTNPLTRRFRRLDDGRQ